jgi:hypothetical protein
MGTTSVSRRVILRATQQALGGTGLVVRAVAIADGVVRLIVATPSEMGRPDATRMLEDRLGYPFWIDLGLVDHTPVFDLVEAR